ncbi:hypothetical protein ABFA07_019252 [Porites harrisoni]
MAGKGSDPSDGEIRGAMADILREGELSKLTSRIVRTQLEEKFGVSFLGRKKEIDAMLMEMIENQEKETENEKEQEQEQENGTSDQANGVEPERSDQEDEESGKDDEPSAKKKKQESHTVDDAELARKLHEDEKGFRARRQNTKKTVERKKSASAKKPKESKGENKGFRKLMALSPVLAELVGQDRMARSDIVKKMWEIIRERKLEDPKNKRFTICDEQLYQVFGLKRFQTFSMMKYLKKHVKDPELLS